MASTADILEPATEAAPEAKPNPFLTGIHAPMTGELVIEDLAVTGTIPAALDGRYLRIGPNPAGPVDPATHHWFVGDGMVHGLRLEGGRARWYRNRWIRSTRVGTNALSFHVLPPYWGWEKFKNRVAEIIQQGWSGCGKPPLQRCGLRYVNALTSTKHSVRGIDDLNLEVSVAGENLVDVTVSFLSQDDAHTEALVRVASIKHVQGDVPEDATFVVDVDVRTTDDISTWDAADLMSWLERAHTIEKSHFFDLLPGNIVEQLEER